MIKASEDIVLSNEQENRIKNIYNVYVKEITPFIISLETFDNEYPIEIINEIRAIFTHISRCYSFSNIDIDAQIISAERHIKRCKLDCYKYFCVSFIDYINQFRREYKNIDLTYINNGNFIKELKNKHKIAESKIRLAKQVDTQNFILRDDLHITQDNLNFSSYCQAICDDDLFQYYEDAYKAYNDCVNFIDDNIDNVEFLRHKAAKKDVLMWFFTIASLLVGVIGLFLAII